jgi:hypothetical protein
MVDSLTVNGVVFEYSGNELTPSDGVPEWPRYVNGHTYIVNDPRRGDYYAVVAAHSSGWQKTPEEALIEVSRKANTWAPILAELARLGIGGGK